MSKEVLKKIKMDFQSIKSKKDLHIDTKNKALSDLMTQLEGLYPKSINDKETEVYKLYIDIANSRNFEHSFYSEVD